MKKKIFRLFSILIAVFITLNSKVLLLAGDNVTVSFCDEEGVLKAFRVVGYFITIAKIVIPAILIISGMRLLFNTLFEDNPDIKKAVYTFIEKFVLGVFIFFIPLIVGAVLNLVSEYNKSTFNKCNTCMIHPYRCSVSNKK